MTIFEHIGSKIREFRTQYGGMGISQEALGKEMNVSTNTISRWETAKYHPTVEDLDKLARFFSRSILEFFPDESPAQDERLGALLRTARDLDSEELEELQRYAEYRRARSLVEKSTTKPVGRPKAG